MYPVLSHHIDLYLYTMASVIECDIIENEHGDSVQIGDAQTTTITWTQGAAPNNTTTQSIAIYQIGNLIHLNGGWKTGPIANNGGVITGSALPAGHWPKVTVHIPIQVNENNGTFQVGDLCINSNGTMTIGKTPDPTGSAFSAAVCAFNLCGTYYVY